MLEPTDDKDEHGIVRRAAIATYGETVHSLVDRSGYSGPFLPGFAAWTSVADPLPPVGLEAIDHVVGNVELGRMNQWVEFYERVMGFTELVHFSDEAISTEYSALMSKVVWDGDGRIKFPINEPAEGKKRSQIDEYLDFYGGPGVQHIAIQTGDIVASVRALRERGIEFMRVPDTYYAELADRFGDVDLDLDSLAELGRARRPRRRGLSAADLLQDGPGSADSVLRADRAARRPRLRRGQLQGVVRGPGARAGAPRQPVGPATRRAKEVPSTMSQPTSERGITYLTPEAYERLSSELNELKTEGRERVSQAIGTAREHGDIRENADYDAAKNEQGMMEARIRQLETLLGSAVVGEVAGTSGVAGPGTVVVLEIAGEEETYFLGSREEAIDGMDVLSVQSVLGQALSGRKVGDKFSYVTPTGRELPVKLLQAEPRS